MKTTKYILLILGLTGLSAALFGIARGLSFSVNLLTIVCSLSLVYGYYELHQSTKKLP